MHTHFSAARASQEQTDLRRHGYRIRRDVWKMMASADVRGSRSLPTYRAATLQSGSPTLGDDDICRRFREPLAANLQIRNLTKRLQTLGDDDGCRRSLHSRRWAAGHAVCFAKKTAPKNFRGSHKVDRRQNAWRICRQKRLTLRKLKPLACARLASLFPLFHSRIPCQ